MIIKTTSSKKTQKAGEDFANKLKGGDVVALYGDLGSGKTVFVQGIAKGLGIDRRILSPTFVFMRSYPIKMQGQDLIFYHLDLYRGERFGDFEALGMEEVFSPYSIVVIEWADRIKNGLPKKRINVKFRQVDERTREIEIVTIDN